MGQPRQNNQETTAEMMKGYVDSLDDYTQATTRNVLPTEQALLDARKIIDPQQHDLDLEMSRKYLPEFTKIGLDQQRQQGMGQAQNDADLLRGPGRDLVTANLEAQKLADSEFYDTRARTNRQLEMMGNSLDDPNGGLSPTERAEIERSLARDNVAKGIDSPTNTSAVASAMKFGSAGAARKSQKQQAINAAVQTAGNVMPALKSGVDVLQLTTGRPSQNNVGVGQMSTNREVGQTTMNLGQGLMNQIGDNQRQTADINSKKKTALDNITGVMNSVGSMSSAI